MEKSEQINELAAALSKFQGKVTSVKMNRTAKVIYTDKNSGQKTDRSYNYADLGAIFDAIRAPLSEVGLSVTQLTSFDQNAVVVTTVLLHSSGQFISESLRMIPADIKIQTIGSTITYCKRYSISSILGISTEEDDDGSLGNGNDKAPAKPQEQPTGQKAAEQPAGPRPTRQRPQRGSTMPAEGEVADQNRLVDQQDLLRLKEARKKQGIDAEKMCDYCEKEFKKRDPVALSVKELNTLIEAINKNPDTVKVGFGF